MIKYNFSVPESDAVASLNGAMLMMLRTYPEWFYDDFRIDSVYGCPRGCIWNGNRDLDGKPCSLEEVGNIFHSYRDLGATYRLTFTNFLLKEKNLTDTYANAIARVAETYNAMAIVAAPMMYDFIRHHYPLLDISWSTTTDFGSVMEKRVEKINELSRERVVVLPFDMNNKPVIRQLQHPENIEVLVNEMCIDDCPMRREHERQSNLYNLGMLKEHPHCLMEKYKNTDKWKMHSMLSRRGLDKYVELGINRFKISGRKEQLQTYIAYAYYFVREEHRQDFRNGVNDIWWKMLLEAKLAQDDIYSAHRQLINDYDEVLSQEQMKVIEKHGVENDGLW